MHDFLAAIDAYPKPAAGVGILLVFLVSLVADMVKTMNRKGKP